MGSSAKSLVIAGVLLAAASTADAADLSMGADTMMAPTAPAEKYVFDWSGHYLGVHGGSFDGVGMGGVQLGINWQNGRNVYGIEGSGSFGDGSDWLAMARLKLGYAFDYPLFTYIIPLEGHTTDHFMIYAIGGLAAAVGGDDDLGWTIGAGVEKRFWDYLSLTLEYDYYDLSNSGDGGHIFKAGLNFRNLWN